jgi:hypothetical protein
MEVSGQLHDLAALPPGKESPVPIAYEAAWTPEPVWTLCRREKPYPCKESKPGCPTRNPSLYRLSYPGSNKYLTRTINTGYIKKLYLF